MSDKTSDTQDVDMSGTKPTMTTADKKDSFSGLEIKSQEHVVVFPLKWSPLMVSPGNHNYPEGTKAFEVKLQAVLREGVAPFWDSSTRSMDTEGYLKHYNSKQGMAQGVMERFGIDANKEDGSIKILESGLLCTDTIFLDVLPGVNVRNYEDHNLRVHSFDTLKAKFCSSLESRQKFCLKHYKGDTVAPATANGDEGAADLDIVASPKRRRGSAPSPPFVNSRAAAFAAADLESPHANTAATTSVAPVLLHYGEGYGLFLAGPKRQINDWKDRALTRIKTYRTIEEFVTEYESRSVFEAMSRLRKALMVCGAEHQRQVDLAGDWALSLADDDVVKLENDPLEQRKHLNACKLDADRKVVLQLLYSLYDACMDPNIPGIDEKTVLESFDKGRRVLDILHCTLVFDQAKGLYFNFHNTIQKRGMHWYAQRHLETREDWRDIQSHYVGRPTINRRLVWFFDKLELWSNPHYERLQWLMEPQYCNVHPRGGGSESETTSRRSMSFEIVDGAEEQVEEETLLGQGAIASVYEAFSEQLYLA